MFHKDGKGFCKKAAGRGIRRDVALKIVNVVNFVYDTAYRKTLALLYQREEKIFL